MQRRNTLSKLIQTISKNVFKTFHLTTLTFSTFNMYVAFMFHFIKIFMWPFSFLSFSCLSIALHGKIIRSALLCLQLWNSRTIMSTEQKLPEFCFHCSSKQTNSETGLKNRPQPLPLPILHLAICNNPPVSHHNITRAVHRAIKLTKTQKPRPIYVENERIANPTKIPYLIPH
jgi:hypothetical protein